MVNQRVSAVQIVLSKHWPNILKRGIDLTQSKLESRTCCPAEVHAVERDPQQLKSQDTSKDSPREKAKKGCEMIYVPYLKFMYNK